MSTTDGSATVMGGIPATNSALYHAIRFRVGDPVAFIRVNGTATLILRDIEMHRARQHARADQIACPADFEPEAGLSGDRGNGDRSGDRRISPSAGRQNGDCRSDSTIDLCRFDPGPGESTSSVITIWALFKDVRKTNSKFNRCDRPRK